MYGTGLFTGGTEFSKSNVGLPVILSDMFFKFCHKSMADNFYNLENIV